MDMRLEVTYKTRSFTLGLKESFHPRVSEAPSDPRSPQCKILDDQSFHRVVLYSNWMWNWDWNCTELTYRLCFATQSGHVLKAVRLLSSMWISISTMFSFFKSQVIKPFLKWVKGSGVCQRAYKIDHPIASTSWFINFCIYWLIYSCQVLRIM